MAKKPAAEPIGTETQVVEELHTSDETVEYTDVTGKDDLPEGVTDLKEEAPAKPAAKAKAAAKAPAGDELPEEFKDKTPAQLAKMYKDAQTVIGRQGSELGDLRRVADEHIKSSLKALTPKPAAAEPAKKPDDVDFFTNPTDAITRLIEAHPELQRLKGQAQESAAREIQRGREEAAVKFNTKHPDAGTILADENFRAWVTKSPLRQAMLVRAHKHYDFQAGDEVFDTWKELQAARTPAAPAEKKPAPQRAAGKEAARVPSGGNAAPAENAKGGEKIYRRADIVRLMEREPDRYASMADEITKAYSEGRVR